MANEPLAWLQSEEGWAGLNREGATAEEAQADTTALLEEFEIAKLFYEVFAAGRGPELLQHLREMLFETPIYQVHGAMAFDHLEISLTPEQWCWVRVGQNSVLSHIRAMMAKAMQGPPELKEQP